MLENSVLAKVKISEKS